jgi:toxin ParE1/3/4
MKFEFHPAALEEYLQAAGWYAERNPGIALSFIESVEDAIERILDAPERWRIINEDIRRCLTRVFSYAILYTIENDYILTRGCVSRPSACATRPARPGGDGSGVW